jgi:uncharacterized protein YcfJ
MVDSEITMGSIAPPYLPLQTKHRSNIAQRGSRVGRDILAFKSFYLKELFMNIAQPVHRIHPLVAVAAISVTVVSLLGVAALTGILPSSHGSAADAANTTSQSAVAHALPASAPQATASDGSVHKTAVHHGNSNAVASTATNGQAPTGPVAQNEGAQQLPAAPVQQKQAVAPHNSPLGIGVGAVIGGILGSQVGGGSGKTLATIAGAVGGGYIGNEVAKRNQ